MRTIKKCSKEDIQAALAKSTNLKGDAFANTFIGKADKQEMWDHCYGVYEGDELLGMSIVTISKRAPLVMNMQLLHTLWDHRFKGVGRALVDDAFKIAKEAGVEYFRVSAEQTAAPFYAKCGITFSGLQKSGTMLALIPLKEQPGKSTHAEFIVKKFVSGNGKIDKDRTLNPTDKDKVTIALLGEQYSPFYIKQDDT